MSLSELLRGMFYVLILTCWVPTSALACSDHPWAQLVSDYIEETDVIFTGTVEYIDNRNIPNKQLNRLAHLKVEKTYRNQTPSELDNVDVYYYFAPKGCFSGIHFQTGETYTVFADRDASGHLTARIHSGEYGWPASKIAFDLIGGVERIVKYLEDGEDYYLVNYKCFHDIRSAYRAEIFTGDLRANYQACEKALKQFEPEFK